jgi:predicted dehydrogenase
MIGSGSYAGKVLVPAFGKTGARLKIIASATGVSAVHVGKKNAVETATTDSASVFGDPEVNVVVIATRHDTHARYVCDALRAGKHVFVEKPLALTLTDLAEISAARVGQPGMLMVGFNRRFAPHVLRAQAMLRTVASPKAISITVNAGEVPADHWTLDPASGGGRIVGEACHFVDLARCLVGHAIKRFEAIGVDGVPDTASIVLKFVDGSIAHINYFANGHRAYPKERIEVFAGGRILVLDNFRRMTGYGWPNFASNRMWRQDKGNEACVAAFVEAVRGGCEPPVSYDDLHEVSRTVIEIADRLRA